MLRLEGIDYFIEIGSITESSLESYIQENYKRSKKIIIVDENTNEYCLEYLITNFESLSKAEVMLIPSGEENKVIDICLQVWEALSDYEISRKDLIINLGGGLVTDMGGFIASIFKRGVDFIHVPTSFLGMIDASIGGKNGVDLDNFKNQLGTFRNPKAIFTDKIFLSTLDEKESVNGFAEALKHAIIQDADLWEDLKSIEDIKDLFTDDFLERIISIKLKVVNEDPTEKGIRKILNFGHTIGHAIEGHFLYKQPIDHGHAVALGMIAESYMSWQVGKLDENTFKEIEAVILSWFPVPVISMDDIAGIIDLLYNDKKNHSGSLQTCLIEGIGTCIYDQALEEDYFSDAILYLISKSVSLN